MILCLWTGQSKKISANRIALSMYKHVDLERFTTKILDQVQKHQKTDEAIDKSDGYIKDSNVRR